LKIFSSKTDFIHAIFVGNTMPALLEICAFTADAAMAALQAGANRVELCDSPYLDGISPPESWFHNIPASMHPQLSVMVRPRGGSFCMTDEEIDLMELEIQQVAANNRAGAVVFGLLTPTGEIDVPACRRLLKAASGLQTVFHRAFDIVTDKSQALETLIECGFNRLLCGLPLNELIALKEQAEGRICIMPGGGIRSHNIQAYLQAGFTEIHSSARIHDLLPDTNELQKLKEACAI
jgi:copper homeostasis protein